MEAVGFVGCLSYNAAQMPVGGMTEEKTIIKGFVLRGRHRAAQMPVGGIPEEKTLIKGFVLQGRHRAAPHCRIIHTNLKLDPNPS
jgi:hypothetical protein